MSCDDKNNNLKIVNIHPSTSIFSISSFKNYNGEVIRFEENGDIFVKCKLIENDKEVVDAFREFFKMQGMLK